MMEQKDDDAISDFQIYIYVDSKIYCPFVEMVNDEPYSLDVMNEAIDLCQKEIFNKNFGLFSPNSGYLPDFRLIQ